MVRVNPSLSAMHTKSPRFAGGGFLYAWRGSVDEPSWLDESAGYAIGTRCVSALLHEWRAPRKVRVTDAAGGFGLCFGAGRFRERLI